MNEIEMMPSILIVEDNNIVLLELKERLLEMNYTVLNTASSGQEAIEKARNHHPDLILMDIRLKGEMDGIEAAERIKKEFDTPVIYITAHTDEKTIARAKITEPFGYIIKPFDERELRTTIEMALYKHKMEKRVKESEHWLSATLKSIGDALIATDSKGIIKLINPAAEEITGWKQEEVFNTDIKNVFKVRNQENKELLENPVISSLRYNSIVGAVNKVLVRKDDTETFIDYSSAPIKKDSNTITGIVLVFRDVMERIDAKRIIEKQKIFLRQIIDTDPNYITVKNSEGRFELTNKAIARALGSTTEEIIGKLDSDYFNEAEIKLLRRLENDVINSQSELFIPEEKLIDSEGKVHLLQTFKRAIDSQNGNEKLVLSVATDITELKLTEKALRESEENLRLKAAELVELNRKLNQSGQELKALNASKDKFFSIIAHDLRSPFATILGLAELLTEEIDNMTKEEIKLMFDDMFKSAKSTFNLLENILQWAGVKTSKIIYNPAIFNLKETVDKIVELYSNSTVHKKITLASEIKESTFVYGDVNMVEVIIRNLISNAIKFTDIGGEIKVSAAIEDDFIKINVTDNGVGIAQNKIEKLFQPEENTSTPGTQNEKGSGLGLILCKEFVEINKGKIIVESELKKGSKFTFTLPGKA
jgi:PAS domain S-box-containing protein